MKKLEEAPEAPQGVAEASFTKEQLLGSKRFQSLQNDVLSVVLADDERYTIEQAEQFIKETLERNVD